ncbi:hypothetical protein DFP93_11642 [Aneurinibacillus soli]|uniref:Uncharacterized protein n=1 Tax=Aneurinibacillus soli TaxID=1500254 RepID=A0A0U5BED6_9BACL|nr:insertion element protein [Aneurinibacillus soli]PYE59675.1 hypothetical protein DFP93_11642 [Aneurinibacillus soli]BAU29324.1 hypothetical protein CB4_03511 [Aneurinibacillus soli]
MGKLKRLATKEDEIVHIELPVSDTERNSRQTDYLLLTPLQFAKKYRHALFQPVTVQYKEQSHSIQMNRCTNPFCKWFGQDQTRFTEVKGKPSRYKLGGSMKHRSQMITCNPDPIHPTRGMTWDCVAQPFSNWSIAEEIARLATLDQVKDRTPDYVFHRDSCTKIMTTPFDQPKDFYKQGKSKSNSQKWQCKTGRKMTNVLPTTRENFSYRQKRNEILPLFAALLLNRTPVKRSCEILGIGSETYYQKSEWLYRRCLEFLERYEKKAFQSKRFKSVWVNTDKLIYYLNNVRKRGKGSHRYDNVEEKHFPTHIVISSDVDTRYVFRSDVAYDWQVRLSDIETDTFLYKEDHVNLFARKNARLRFSYCPQPPSPHDTQSTLEYVQELNEFERRDQYIDGLHVNSTYTTIAHFWLMKQMIHTNEWRFVTDEDFSIMTALFRVFAREVRRADAHHFLCKIDRTKSLKDAFTEYQDTIRDLEVWGARKGYSGSVRKLAFLWLSEFLKHHTFHEEVNVGGNVYRKEASTFMEHPLPSIDQGVRLVDCTTDVSSFDIAHIANMILKVNDKATSSFMQQIRRRLSILERPLVTARKEGKSYIYSNFNPKYAQYAVTILRTYYNFCMTYKTSDGERLTPAQRIGITHKRFTMKDILYFK